MSSSIGTSGFSPAFVDEALAHLSCVPQFFPSSQTQNKFISWTFHPTFNTAFSDIFATFNVIPLLVASSCPHSSPPSTETIPSSTPWFTNPFPYHPLPRNTSLSRPSWLVSEVYVHFLQPRLMHCVPEEGFFTSVRPSRLGDNFALSAKACWSYQLLPTFVIGLLHCQSNATCKVEEQHLIFHLGGL